MEETSLVGGTIRAIEADAWWTVIRLTMRRMVPTSTVVHQ
jgi:hypothetical protein